MKKIIAYLIVWLVSIVTVFLVPQAVAMPSWIENSMQFIHCAAVGALGGTIYCFRGVYKNRCIEDRWELRWETWYYLRPIASTVCGAVSLIFLKAGIIFLDAASQNNSVGYGYLAVAFIAGYNVDNFLKLIEEKSKSILGIEKSNAAKD